MIRHFLVFALGALLWAGLAGGPEARVVNRLGGADFTTLGAALAAANPGEVIEIDAAGNPYPDEGSLFVGQTGVTLTSRNGKALLLRTSLLVTANNVTLDNLHMDGEKATRRLVRVVGASGATIRDCSLVNPASGESNTTTDDDLLNPVEYLDSGAAISLEGGANILIENNDLRSAPDAALLNQTNIFVGPGTGARSGLTIRGNLLGAQTRNISMWTGWSDVVVENNVFQRATLGTLRAGSGLLVSTLRSETQPADQLCRNWSIRNNTFVYSNDSNIAFEHARVESVLIEGNTFTTAADYNAVTLLAAGSGVVVRNNTVQSTGGVAINVTNGESQPPGAALSGLVVRDNHFANPASAVQIGEDVNAGILIEDNLIDQVASNLAFQLTGGNSSALIRGNQVSRGGTSSCINVNAQGATVVDNVLVGGRRGISFFSQSTFTHVGGGNLAARNLVVEPGLSGSAGRIHGIGDWNDVASYVAQSNNRIIGNTIVLSGNDGVFIATPGAVCYNNISAFNAGAGFRVATGVTPTLLDFNLAFQNGAGNYAGATAGPHSLVANPQFVTFFGVSTGADFRLAPGSPARNRGSSNGLDPDFTTELGAFQDAMVETAVPAAGWQLYR